MLRSNTAMNARSLEKVTSHVLIGRGGDVRFRSMQVNRPHFIEAVPMRKATSPVPEATDYVPVVNTVEYHLISVVHGVAIWEEY